MRRSVCLSIFAVCVLTLTTGEVGALADGLRNRFDNSRLRDISSTDACVAAGQDVVFVGEPLQGSVAVLARNGGRLLGTLPPPPNGFALPFIIHSAGEGRVVVLDAGGLPQPSPFVRPLRRCTSTSTTSARHMTLRRSWCAAFRWPACRWLLGRLRATG